jgi:hypothetical protein
MSAVDGMMPTSSPMYLDDRLPEGYVVVCADDGAEHSFMLRRLGPSIECPKCGRTALPAGLLDTYYERVGTIFDTSGFGRMTQLSSG